MTRSGRNREKLAAALAFATLVATAAPAAALEPINKSWLGVAVKGYDVVAYFERGKAVEGSADHAYEWNGASWHFASAADRDKFAADPQRYAPAYGGYCAYAVSQSTTAPIDPKAWKIVDGRLYLTLNKKVRSLWEQDLAGNIARADVNWVKLLHPEEAEEDPPDDSAPGATEPNSPE